MVAFVSIMRGVHTSQHNSRVCDNESHAKLSNLKGLRKLHILKEARIHEFEKEVEEAEREVDKAKLEVVKMQELVNRTYDEADELMTEINNMTTSGLGELEELQICSEENFVTDCCQVRAIFSNTVIIKLWCNRQYSYYSYNCNFVQIKRMHPSSPSGIYTIKAPCMGDKPFSYAKLAVYCDMETAGGGWTVIQRRNASMGWVKFARNWADYEKGFGDLDGEFWIGLKNIYELTTQQNMALRLSVWNTSTDSFYWKYPLFAVSSRSDRYALSTSMSTGSGSSIQSPFAYGGRSDNYFTTYDRYSGPRNCGYIRQSGWWYYNANCNYANLNGRHQPSGLWGTSKVGERLVWLSGGYNIYTNSEMKIRPQRCQPH